QIALAAITVTGLATASLHSEEAKEAKGATVTFKVKGMMCDSCEGAVRKAVGKLEGIKGVLADSEKGTALVDYDPAKTSEEKIAAAINTTNFKVAK
ncbi:MAG: heavy-metal-associated domain-containing protein, partial [Verrucomicrobiaceae bacterium]